VSLCGHGLAHYDHHYVLALTDIFKPTVEQPGCAHLGAASDLIRIGQRLPYLGQILRQQIRVSVSNVRFTLVR
jgi:hypothetical protein